MSGTCRSARPRSPNKPPTTRTNKGTKARHNLRPSHRYNTSRRTSTSLRSSISRNLNNTNLNLNNINLSHNNTSRSLNLSLRASAHSNSSAKPGANPSDASANPAGSNRPADDHSVQQQLQPAKAASVDSTTSGPHYSNVSSALRSSPSDISRPSTVASDRDPPQRATTDHQIRLLSPSPTPSAIPNDRR